MAFRHKTLILIFTAMLAMGFFSGRFARAGSAGRSAAEGGTVSARRATATALEARLRWSAP